MFPRFGAVQESSPSSHGQHHYSHNLRTLLPRILSLIFLVPAVAFFSLFVVYPIIWVLMTSFLGQTLHGLIRFEGLHNYSSLLADPVFWRVLANMLIWAITTIPIQMIIGGTIAYGIERHMKRSKGFFRTVFFLPVITSVSVIAIVWAQIYAPYYGLLQQMFRDIGLNFQSNLLGTANTVIYAIIIVNIWEWTGFSMLMYIAGIHSIPSEIFDSAKIDGASGLRLARYILIPMLSPVSKALLLLGVIGTLQTFPLVYLMTDGGPDHASEVFGTYIFRQGFVIGNTGYASALSTSVLIIAFVLTVLQLKFLRSRFSVNVRGDDRT
ncbi:MAG: sugar ABC transporter permease [Alicyclobacillus sp.]|nr:sugar ABC transporter permease [Alicyclobacillus sp.]